MLFKISFFELLLFCNQCSNAVSRPDLLLNFQVGFGLFGVEVLTWVSLVGVGATVSVLIEASVESSFVTKVADNVSMAVAAAAHAFFFFKFLIL